MNYMQQIGPTHCLKCHQNTEDFANHLCNPAFTSACTPACGRFYKPKDLTDRIEFIMNGYYGPTAYRKKVVREIAALLEEEVAHDTLDGYCCACDYDQAEFEHKLTKFKTRILERSPTTKVENNEYCKGWNDALEEMWKIIKDL